MRILSSIILAFFIGSCASIDTKDQHSRKIRDLEKQYESRSWADRLKAVEAADSFRDSNAEKFLIKACSDSHEKVKYAALDQLKNYDTPGTRAYLRNTVLSEPNTNIRWICTRSLAVICNPSDNDLFIRLCTEKNWIVREQAALGFLKTSTDEVINRNLQTLTGLLNDPSENVRMIVLNNVTCRNSVILSELSKQIQAENVAYRPEYLSLLLKALTGYKLDEKTRNIAAQFVTHPNENVRIAAYTCVRTSDGIKDQ
jgi:HEAT repeat protein